MQRKEKQLENYKSKNLTRLKIPVTEKTICRVREVAFFKKSGQTSHWFLKFPDDCYRESAAELFGAKLHRLFIANSPKAKVVRFEDRAGVVSQAVPGSGVDTKVCTNLPMIYLLAMLTRDPDLHIGNLLFTEATGWLRIDHEFLFDDAVGPGSTVTDFSFQTLNFNEVLPCFPALFAGPLEYFGEQFQLEFYDSLIKLLVYPQAILRGLTRLPDNFLAYDSGDEQVRSELIYQMARYNKQMDYFFNDLATLKEKALADSGFLAYLAEKAKHADGYAEQLFEALAVCESGLSRNRLQDYEVKIKATVKELLLHDCEAEKTQKPGGCALM